jgi:hypothetical protein
VNVVQYTTKHWELTDEGKDVAANGSHEARVFNAVPSEGIAQADIMVCTTCVTQCKLSFILSYISVNKYYRNEHFYQ